MPKHVHVDLMAEYAKDAATTREPWELWQFRSLPSEDWEDCSGSLLWRENHEYRRKLKTIRIGDIDVPEPLRVPPDEDTYYYTPCPSFAVVYERCLWDGGEFDLRQLENGLAHLTKEAAITHAKAIISLTKIK